MSQPTTTQGFLLGGRVHHHQPTHGHRTSLEPVLLAAAIPARPGQRVLEGGTGAGSALLCLATRIPGLHGLGIEQNPDQAALARSNIAANNLPNLTILEADLTTPHTLGPFDHAFANPPWHNPASTPSPNPSHDSARRAHPTLLARWAHALATPLRHHGTLTLIIATSALATCLAATQSANCGSPTILPLWPKPNRPAKLTLLRTIKGGRGPCQILPGLTLHTETGTYTPDASAILRDMAPVAW